MATDLMAVTYINNTLRGAPVLNGQAGSLVALLDAFLITGFGLTTATSVTVSGGIATATLPSGQSFEPYSIVLVEGATPASLNGRQRVLTASSTSITWATTAPDGAASGTVSIKYAPAAGWEKPFAATNKAVYRSGDLAGSRFYYRIDDSGTTTARVRGYESMSDVDTGVAPFPTNEQMAGGGWWGKSSAANANAVRYDLAADSRMLLVMIAPYFASNSVYSSAYARGFGDLVALSPAGDAYAAAVSAADSEQNALQYGYGAFSGRAVSTSFAIVCARGLAGLGGAQRADCAPLVGHLTLSSGADGTLGIFPSPADGQLKYAKRFVRVGAADTDAPRAWVPGVLHIPQTGVLAAGVNSRDIIVGGGELASRKLLAVANSGDQGNVYPLSSVYLIDITGPWR